MTTEFFIFGLARLTLICNPSTDSETSLKVMGYWKFSQKAKLKQKFFTDNEKEVGNFFKTGTIVIYSLWVPILTTILLQVKTFVLYPHHYDQEVLPSEVQMFFKALAGRS